MKEKFNLSIVIPVFNEQDNIASLIVEIMAALDGKFNYELIYVNDGSTDDTLNALSKKQKTCPQLRIIQHTKCSGQSAAIRTGVKYAKAKWIATLDGDGQNLPEDIPNLYKQAVNAKSEDNVWLIAGWRKKRDDSWLKLQSSKYANAIRGWMLKDNTPDSGCGLKIFRRDVFLDIPSFKHMHRYLPALYKRAGGKVINSEVQHRARKRGKTKYGFWNRAIVGIFDLLGVAWLIRRSNRPEISEYSADDK